MFDVLKQNFRIKKNTGILINGSVFESNGIEKYFFLIEN